jgi:hypothetical protein
MKNIVRFQIVKPQGRVTIDASNPDFKYLEFEDILNQLLPYTRLFEEIVIKNFTVVPETLLNRLTNQYLHGTQIVFMVPAKRLYKVYKAPRSKAFYAYTWKPLDLSAPIPKSLAEFTFDYKGKQTTYLDAIRTLTSTRFLPNEIWNALDDYSRKQIDKCREYNRGEYPLAETWYKTLMKDYMSYGFKVFSPNKKTYFEALAELDFSKDCRMYQLKKGLRPLNLAELTFLRQYAPAYGVEIPTFKWRVNSRKTAHGYTEEPEVCLTSMSTNDWTTVSYDPRNDNNLPSFVRQNLVVHENENDKLLRDAYFQLTWIIKNLKDDGLMPGWKRCPECHELYREHEGCECGACPPIHLINADNLFYSNAESYEDKDCTDSYYQELLLEDTEDLDEQDYNIE